MQQNLPHQDIQKSCLSLWAPNSSDNDMLNVATVLCHIMIDLSEAVSDEDKIMVITKMVFSLIKQNGY
jgi:hypothetical protein